MFENRHASSQRRRRLLTDFRRVSENPQTFPASSDPYSADIPIISAGLIVEAEIALHRPPCRRATYALFRKRLYHALPTGRQRRCPLRFLRPLPGKGGKILLRRIFFFYLASLIFFEKSRESRDQPDAALRHFTGEPPGFIRLRFEELSVFYRIDAVLNGAAHAYEAIAVRCDALAHPVRLICSRGISSGDMKRRISYHRVVYPHFRPCVARGRHDFLSGPLRRVSAPSRFYKFGGAVARHGKIGRVASGYRKRLARTYHSGPHPRAPLRRSRGTLRQGRKSSRDPLRM